MLIDDNKIDLFVNQRVIEKFDALANTLAFSNAPNALKYLEDFDSTSQYHRENFPHIIFLDINMPEMNGFQFLNKIKKLEVIHNIRPQIYLLSSSSLGEDKRKANEEELCTDYLSKPLTLEKITHLLAKPEPNFEILKSLKQQS